MEKSSKRGKIPQQDWPLIIKRYESGETLASIARTYDCSPPAISYIVSRSRARDATAESAAASAIEPPEPGLVQGHPVEIPAAEVSPPGPDIGETSGSDIGVSYPIGGLHTGPQQPEPRVPPAQRPDIVALRSDDIVGQGNNAAEPDERGLRDTKDPVGNGSVQRSFGVAAAPPQNGEPRRTLHLSLAQENNQRAEAQHRNALGANVSSSSESAALRSEGHQQGFVPPGRPGPGHYAPAPNGGAVHKTPEPRGTAREGGAFIDQALRERVEGDITAFLAAFDAALADDTVESRAGLREATDRLLRAGARTRIELERLEARLPLPPRDGHSASVWRPR
jgi:hypothetical protein